MATSESERSRGEQPATAETKPTHASPHTPYESQNPKNPSSAENPLLIQQKPLDGNTAPQEIDSKPSGLPMHSPRFPPVPHPNARPYPNASRPGHSNVVFQPPPAGLSLSGVPLPMPARTIQSGFPHGPSQGMRQSGRSLLPPQISPPGHLSMPPMLPRGSPLPPHPGIQPSRTMQSIPPGQWTPTSRPPPTPLPGTQQSQPSHGLGFPGGTTSALPHPIPEHGMPRVFSNLPRGMPPLNAFPPYPIREASPVSHAGTPLVASSPQGQLSTMPPFIRPFPPLTQGNASLNRSLDSMVMHPQSQDSSAQPSAEPSTFVKIDSSSKEIGIGSEVRESGRVIAGQNEPEEKSIENAEANPEAWTAHKTEDGKVYYFNSITGKSTFEKPKGLNIEVQKVASQIMPVAWERIPSSDWAIVTTNDAKKYYYNTVTKETSWQVPSEVVEVRKKVQEEQEKEKEKGKEDQEKDVETPISNLDFIKKKLQDPSSLMGKDVIVAEQDEKEEIDEGEKENVKGVDLSSDKEKEDHLDGEEDKETSKEDKEKQFREMLIEKNIPPFAKWEKELPRILFDPRFKAIPSHSSRRAIFEHFVKTRAEEERKERRAVLKAAIDAFRTLLDEVSQKLDHTMDHDNFAKKWGEDPRFLGLEKKEREALINERVAPLKKAEEERRKALHDKAVLDFKSLILELKNLNGSSRWIKVKDQIKSDPRYSGIPRVEREEIFNSHISKLRAEEEERLKAEKAKREEEERRKEKEREAKKRKEREEAEEERRRVRIKRKEGAIKFQLLLEERVKDADASWTETRTSFEKDQVWSSLPGELEISERESMFREHVKKILAKCREEYIQFLREVIPATPSSNQSGGRNPYTSWSVAKGLLKSDPRYSALPRHERESMWQKYVNEILQPLGKERAEGSSPHHGTASEKNDAKDRPGHDRSEPSINGRKESDHHRDRPGQGHGRDHRDHDRRRNSDADQRRRGPPPHRHPYDRHEHNADYRGGREVRDGPVRSSR